MIEYGIAWFAVLIACSSWNVTPPALCVNEFRDCVKVEKKIVKACKKKVLNKWEPKEKTD